MFLAGSGEASLRILHSYPKQQAKKAREPGVAMLCARLSVVF